MAVLDTGRVKFLLVIFSLQPSELAVTVSNRHFHTVLPSHPHLPITRRDAKSKRTRSPWKFLRLRTFCRGEKSRRGVQRQRGSCVPLPPTQALLVHAVAGCK